MDNQEANAGICVPVVTSLGDIYDDVNNSVQEKHEKRYKSIRDRFYGIYGMVPEFYCRAPGRVNLCGDHIDCQEYPVLPTALEQDFIMAYVKVTEGDGSDQIVINNVEDVLYPEIKVSTDPYQDLQDKSGPINYFICGYKAILAHDDELKAQVAKPCGLKILIDSKVPWAAGLGSSSSFTVCSAITTAHANGVLDKIKQKQLADLTINAERLAGTACGGMDQTISLLGEAGKVARIDFVPEITCTNIKLPESVQLVICNSCTPAKKVLTLGIHFNKRVCECRFALAAMTVQAGLAESFDDCPFKTFKQLQVKLDYTLDQMLELAKASFESLDEYTPEKLKSEFKTDDPWKLVVDVPEWQEVKKQNQSFQLYKRAYYVFTEAKRIQDYQDLFADENVPEEQKIVQLGKWMTESQLSCQFNYENSCKQLDELTSLNLQAGALGSKLSGAGWGGCTVSLVPKDKVAEFMEKVKPYYAKERDAGEELCILENLDSVFPASSSVGACVIDPKLNPQWHQ